MGRFHISYATNTIVVAMNPDRTGGTRQPADSRGNDLDPFSCSLPFYREVEGRLNHVTVQREHPELH
jgi:hypothetical protein